MPAANKSSANFADACRPFIEAGISNKYLIPVVPFGATLSKNATVEERHIGKAPGRYNAKTGEWSGLYGKGLMTEGTTATEVETWAPWPTANVGVLGLGFPGIDSDAETPVAAKLVMAALVKTFGKDFGAAERIRGKGHRRLFAFQAYSKAGVRTRHVIFTPKGDKVASKVDVIGRGAQYVASGKHPSGDVYGWRKGASLADRQCKLDEITDDDVDAFLANLKEGVEDQGGTMNKDARAGGGGQDRDVRDLEPAMSLRDALHGLNSIPNSEDNFPDREDFVSILSAIRAALGRDADDAEDDIREWACNSAMEPDWCSEEYFQKAWDSLRTVRVDQDALERIFRRNGMSHVSQAAFPEDDHAEVAHVVTTAKAATTAGKEALLDTVADMLAFRDANRLAGLDGTVVRAREDVTVEITALSWWKQEALLSDGALLARIQSEDTYPRDKVGLANFLRDMRALRPDSFFDDTTLDPGTEQGDTVIEELDGHRRRLLNLRRQSSAILLGRLPTKNPKRDKEDVDTILRLVERMFGKHADFELDTLAYMAQTGDRPGSMLFLVGDKGVGKSVYVEMLIYLFDGVSSRGKGYVDGAKIANESSRRFAYAKIEGCRILSHRELPKGMKASAMAEMTAQFKVLCDRSIAGDVIYVEEKGVPLHPIRNVCRVIVSSNHSDAIEVEEGDRRIFFIDSGITVSNRFSEAFYKEFIAITTDPARLAAFWRYLLARDIGDYSAYTAPPVTREKLRRQIMSQTPTRRHFHAAIALLNASKREATTNRELKEIMWRMSVTEHENSGGAIDDVFDYRTLAGKDTVGNTTARELSAAIRGTAREVFAPVGKDFRLGSGREGFKAFVLERGMRNRLLPVLQSKASADALRIIEDDIYENPFISHPLEEFRERENEDNGDDI